MKPDIIKKQILKLVSQQKKPVPTSTIASELNLRKTARKRLQRWLSEMVNDGLLFRSGKGSYSLGGDEDLFTGHIDILRSGDAFLTIEESGKEVRIDRSDLATAMQGDKVLARYKLVSRKGSEDVEYAKVIRVIDRVSHDVVGTLRTTGRMTYVVPIDRKYRQDFYVAASGEAKEGDRVVVRFVAWEDPKLMPEGEIVDVIGPESDASLDTLAVIKSLRIREEFPDPVMNDAENVSGFLEQKGRRRDLRKQLVVTIDPVRARDFDDALSLEQRPGGIRRVGIHIADVAHFVREGSALDKEAKERGNSVYFPDKVVPMLPEQLSNGICSLRPDQDRLAFSAFLDIDSSGTVVKRDFARTVIRSKRRLTYEEALVMLESKGKASGKDARVKPLLKELSAIAQKLRQRRFLNGALELDVPESEFEIGDDGMICDIKSVSTDESHQLVEEFMIAANEAVAVKLSETKAPGIYRVHEPPFEERLDELAATLRGIGFQPGNLKTQKGLGAFLKSIEGKPLAHYARIEVLKSMNRAMYSTNSKIGHYGLAKRHYLHFTSPIRRYPDLVVHRELARVLTSKGAAGRKSRLGATAKHCTATEKNADQAERNVTEIKKYRFLERELASGKPQTREAVVVNIMRFGLFVELMDLQVQGLVHISTLARGRSRYDRSRNEVRAGKKTYRPGEKVKVRVSKVDFEQRKIDFVPVFARNSA